MHVDLFSEDDPDGVHVRLVRYDQQLVPLLENRIRAGDEHFPVLHDTGDDETLPHVSDHFDQGLAEDGGVFHLTVHAAGAVAGIAFFVQFGFLMVQVDFQDPFGQDDQENDAEYAERIGDGIGGGQSGRGGGSGFRGTATGDDRVRKGLLRSTQARGIGHGTGHDARHRSEAFAGHHMDEPGHQDGQQYQSDGKEVHDDTAFLEGMEESGADLQADGKDKEDQAEILDEGKGRRIGPETEMTQQDTYKQDPGRANRYTLDLETSQIQAQSDDDGEKQDGMGDSRTEKQILHMVRIRS